MCTDTRSKKADLFEGGNLWMPFPWEWGQMRRNREAREAAKAAKAAKAARSVILVQDSDDENTSPRTDARVVDRASFSDLWSASDPEATPSRSRKRSLASVVNSTPKLPKRPRYKVHACGVWLPKLR
ncbi:unnamed protein product, partial [Prorocentrum cordatum]